MKSLSVLSMLAFKCNRRSMFLISKKPERLILYVIQAKQTEVVLKIIVR